MECDRSVIEDKLGSSTGITDNNIMSYLGLVEHKTNELLTIQAFLMSKVSIWTFYTYSHCIYCIYFDFCPVIQCVFVFTGSEKGLQSERPGQTSIGSESRSTSAKYYHATCSGQVSLLCVSYMFEIKYVQIFKHTELMNVSVLLISVQYDAEEPLGTDEEERPLSQEELRRRIIKGVGAIKSHTYSENIT